MESSTFGESSTTSKQPQSPSCSSNHGNNNNNDAGNFECNICFDLAQDPIVTLCGHLFCWPCLYKWLQLHSRSQRECPVCNALIEEEKLVPLYGHGNNSADPRSKSIPAVIHIPNRPSSTPPPLEQNHQFSQTGFEFMGGLRGYANNAFHGVHAHGFPQNEIQGELDYCLKMLLLFVGVCVILALIGL